MQAPDRAGNSSTPRGPAATLCRVALVFGVLALAATLTTSFAPPASAQAWGFNWIQQLFKPQQPAAREVEKRPRAPRVVRHPVEKKPEIAAVPPSFFVAVLGDSLGQMLGQGLSEAFSARPEVAILRKARENSGLVRSDFYDWVKGAQDLLASGEKINVAVILIGSNDHQAMRDGSATYEPHSPKWDEIYAARIEAIAGQFRDKKIPLIWVGLPIMKSDRMSKEAVALNEAYKDHATKAGATYVDIWEAFGDDHGAFAASGPDVEGQVVRLRSGDGIHFTKAGARKLAHFVEDDIKRVLDATEPEDETQFAKLSPEPQGPAARPPATAPDRPLPKPPIGPVLPLTVLPISHDGLLVSRAAKEPQPRLEEASDSSSPLAQKPGRADDFTWPRP
ncbi:MAG: DUF459 domain-containing protein [Beijerinckiaceae bacterium]